MLHPIPYLSFDGTCAEAMRFYVQRAGGGWRGHHGSAAHVLGEDFRHADR